MTNIAWKNLSRERGRLLISIGGVAFSVLLILLLRGLYTGITEQATEYIRSTEADLWIAQAGSPGDFFHSVSLIPAGSEAEIERVPGVAEVHPLASIPVVFKLDGADVDFRLMGVDLGGNAGGPPGLEEGTNLAREGELVVDRVFADNHDVRLGDSLSIRGRPLEVVGIAEGGNAVVSQFAWAALPDVVRLLGKEGVVNYFIVRVEEGTSARQVARDVGGRLTGLQAFTAAEFEEKNVADLREGFLPILWVLVVIALAIGVAVIGLTIYTATIEKSREYGVLKAIGFSNGRLYRIVYQQSISAAAAGFAAGAVLSFGLAALLGRLIPSFVTSIRPVDLALAAGAALFMALLSSFIPLRPVARLDPAEVFRS